MIVYITTNIINGKKYIGVDTKNNPEYLGSGLLLNKAIKKYGRENFKKEILEECNSEEEVFNRERYWIDYYKACESKEYYNIAEGGHGGNTLKGLNQEQKQKRAYKLHIANKGVKLSEEHKKKIGLGRKGIIFSEEQKQKISKSKKGHKCYINWAPRKGKKYSLTTEQYLKHVETIRKAKNKPILQYNTQGNFIKEYESGKEASRQLKLNQANIYKCCSNNKLDKNSTCGGFIFKFKEQ